MSVFRLKDSDVGLMSSRFFKMLGSDEMRAWYGPDHVRLAADRGAVGALLISDELFRYVETHGEPGNLSYTRHRASDPKERKRYVALVEDIQRKGGEVLQFSSMHESGQRKLITPSMLRVMVDPFQELNQLTGIAAILTFPLDIEVVEMEEREAKEQAISEVEEQIDDTGGVTPAGT